jgi:hypothetical protein
VGQTESTSQETTNVLTMPQEFHDKDWAEKLAVARRIRDEVTEQRDRNPVDLVEYRVVRTAH